MMRKSTSRATAEVADLSLIRRAPAPEAHPGLASGLPTLATARLTSVEGGTFVVELLPGREVPAVLDAAVHPSVVASAHARGERVLVEVRGDEVTVVGALRTRPTPGSERAEEYLIEADRVRIEGNEVSLSSKTAWIALRAIGEIESFADRIVSRAEGVHKIVGRMLRLN